MGGSRLKVGYVILLILSVVSGAVLFNWEGLPEVYTVFRENIEESRVERQLFEAYNVMDDTFHFELPDTWNTYEMDFTGGEILYHMGFNSRDRIIHGFVQVWQLSEPLKEFIEESKESATGVVDFKHYNIKEIFVDNKKGYLLDYSRANQEGEYNRAYEVFLEGFSNRVYRLSFFVPEKEWRDYYRILFNRIVKLIKIKKE